MNPTFEETVNFISNFNKMSHPVNDQIGGEIAEMIAELRLDLSEEEANELFHQCWSNLADSPFWDTETRKTIMSFNKKEEQIL